TSLSIDKFLRRSRPGCLGSGDSHRRPSHPSHGHPSARAGHYTPRRMRSPKWWFYQLGMGLALLLAGPILLLRRGGHYRPTLRGRLGGGLPLERVPQEEGGLWLHAVSVGEVG